MATAPSTIPGDAPENAAGVSTGGALKTTVLAAALALTLLFMAPGGASAEQSSACTAVEQGAGNGPPPGSEARSPADSPGMLSGSGPQCGDGYCHPREIHRRSRNCCETDCGVTCEPR